MISPLPPNIGPQAYWVLRRRRRVQSTVIGNVFWAVAFGFVLLAIAIGLGLVNVTI